MTNHTDIINRIISIIKSNPALWSDDIHSKKGTLLSVRFGEPEWNNEKTVQTPYCYVATPPTRLESTRESVGLSQNTTHPFLAEYQIGIVSGKNKTKHTQQELYTFLDEIRNTIQNNPTLTDPVSGTDPKVIRTLIVSTERVSQTRGREVDSVIVTIQCQIVSQFSMSIPGISGDIQLIDKPIERESQQFENIYNAAGIRQRAAPVSETHSFFATIEYSQNVMSQLRTLKRNRTKSSYTFKRGNTPETFDAYLVDIANGAPFNGMETIVLQLEIVH